MRHHISPHHTLQAERREHKEEVLGPSSWAGSSPHHITDITSHHITHHKPKEENTEKKLLGRVLGPERRNLTTSHITHDRISPDMRHHISPHHTLQAERREHKEEVLGPSSWAGWLTTPHHRHHISPHHTSQAERREHREEVVGPSSWAGEAKSHHITHHHISPHQTSQAERRNLTTSHHTSLHLTRQQTSHLTTSHITSRKKRTQRRSCWAEFLGMAFSPHHTSSHLSTSDITSRKTQSHHITHHTSL